jgi:hypothetical protein
VLRARSSSSLNKSVSHSYGGQSTFNQTVRASLSHSRNT